MPAGMMAVRRAARRIELRLCIALAVVSMLSFIAAAARADDAVATIERVKKSVVALGTYERTRSPAFQFRSTAFAVGDGSLIATNAHALPLTLDGEHRETLAIAIPSPGREPEIREARQVAVDADTDLALLRIGGQRLPPLSLGETARVKEGRGILMTGFPIGGVLGIFPVTHRGMISAITPIVIPPPTAAQLNAKVYRRLTTGAIPVFQLDATAYPGNSGSPIYDPDTGEVLGIVNMVFVKGTKEAALTQPSGITYAIPVDHLQALLARPHG